MFSWERTLTHREVENVRKRSFNNLNPTIVEKIENTRSQLSLALSHFNNILIQLKIIPGGL